ncbi:MAG: alpha/beta hydrolase, partial [Acidobacteriota bacterium]
TKTLKAWRWGSPGPTVVLIHGWGGRGLQLGAFAEPLVDAGFRVVAIDLPAHGSSSGESTSLPEAAAALRWVLDRAQREPGGLAGVVAHSFGCAVISAAIAASMEPPQRTVFLAPPSDLNAVIERFGELTGFGPAVMERMRRDLASRFRFDWGQVQPYRVAAQLTSPLLVIHDVDDTETPWTAGRQLAESSPSGRFQLTHGLGHFRLLRSPEVVGQAVRFFNGEEEFFEPQKRTDL